MRWPSVLVSATLLISPGWLTAAAIAQVRVLPAEVARGLNGHRADITLFPGSGVNIDFSQTDELVRKVWLDDPSRILLDFDGDLEAGGARVIHLRRIDPLKIPGLPATPTTLLSVVTKSPAGATSLYSFRISYASGKPPYATVRVEPERARSQPTELRTATGKPVEATSVQFGLQRALREQLIPPDSPLVSRVREMMVLVANGSNWREAASTAQVSLAVVTQLAEMGALPPIPLVEEKTQKVLPSPLPTEES